MHNKIYLVEDDEMIRTMVSEALGKWGFIIYCVENFQRVMEEFEEIQPDLVLLDIGLPYFNGYHWCEEIRKVSNVPTIFLSSASDKMNIVMAVNIGGDDFISKPFDLDILVAKVQAVLRRTYTFKENEQQVTYKEWSLALAENQLFYGDQMLSLTPNETKILALLFATPEKAVSKELIMEKLWESEEFISKNTLTVNVARLRKKLSDQGVPSIIQTIKGKGYVLVESDEE
ncbi:DNA-binding response regulator [Enterococcus sp. JM4C]|uniref:response regulator transcription factor n=1 Tax=Candidatus Enterococcus huntleyi TaxID=1857217 RepID=UPI001379DA9A|nr:response regulator transcription factor [Enterococcus sp. JM4C]KAF1297332.1 DNA-binding response regulator [Enterococcus sp. JM4C]